ncbi:P-loop containing NTP hydrolase pore-1 family protein [Acanthocheilonema viteae]
MVLLTYNIYVFKQSSVRSSEWMTHHYTVHIRMDDLLSAAICEAGLEEFFLAPEIVDKEVEKSSESDIAIQPVNVSGQTNALTEFSRAESEDKQNVEILSDGCVSLPSCSSTDFESNLRADTPRADDLSNNITENAPPTAVQQQLVEVVETTELPRDLSLGNAKRTILSQPRNTSNLPDSGNVFGLRRLVTSTQQRSQLSSGMPFKNAGTAQSTVKITRETWRADSQVDDDNDVEIIGGTSYTSGTSRTLPPRRVVIMKERPRNGLAYLRQRNWEIMSRRIPPPHTLLSRNGNWTFGVRGSRVIRPVFRSDRPSIFLQRSTTRLGCIERDPVNVLQETGHQYLPSAALNAHPRIIRNSVLRRTSPVSVQGSRPGAITTRMIPSLQRARSHLAGSIAGIKPISCPEISGNNCGNEKRELDTAGQIRVLGNSVESRLPVGEVLRRIRINEQKPAHADEYRRRSIGGSGTSKDEVSLDNSRNTERKLLSHVLEQKEKKSSVRKEMETALKYRITQNDQDIDDEEENLGYAETYADYRPAKLRSGLSHPDSVIETASLSSVAPPDIRYNLTVPEEIIDTGAISAVQLETVVYACQAHEMRLPSNERVGYLIGDGAGVGKGRTIACIIFENYLLGRKRSIWLSVSADLRYDAERDLRDIGAKNIKIYALNKFKYSKIGGKENGVKKGCIFATYSSLIGECRSAKVKYRTRLKQLIQWFGQDYDGVIVLDECHRAKNLVPTSGSKPTKTGRSVMELQKALPNARIVYASATGATEPRNMAYMTRIGLWGQGQAFREFSDFINAVEKRGVGAMEVVAMDMKQRGLYLARQLSFRGVTFRVEEVPLSADFIEIYDASVKIWLECRRQFQAALSRHCISRAQIKLIWGQFWAAHQRFFKYICISAKVKSCVKIVRDAIKANKCVVIGLQTTGESKTLEALDDAGGELTEFVSTAKAVLARLIEKHFPTENTNSSADVYTNFDKMCNELDRPVKRKFEKLGSVSIGISAKRLKQNSVTEEQTNEEGHTDSDSTESSARDDSSQPTEEEDEESSSEEKEPSNGAIQGDEDTWLQRLLDEAKSSGEETAEEKSGSEKEKEGSDEEEFNPFTCDFTREDPWAAKQQIISDSPKKKKVKKKKFKKKQKKSATSRIVSTAMHSTADVFMSSSRLVSDEDLTLGETSLIKAELLAAVERLSPRLPPNTLDQLIDELGGPEYVAEMTGRKGRVVCREDGDVEYELRHAGADVPLELMNMDEKDKFMKGEKLVAVISEAASSGISLQSDRRAANRRRRVHITLELPWSADKAIQQFGRTHRSNQVSAPEYIFLISELAGEKRFASIVAKRLESLGALTHGDRRATESRDLSQFNLDTRYGRAALDVLLRTITGLLDPPLIPPPEDYKPGNFISDMQCYMEGVGLLSLDDGVYVIEKESATIPKFLNRLLGLPVHAQNALFQYFSDIVAELVAQAKHDGTYDMGIMDLGMGGDEARKLETRVFMGHYESGFFRVEIHKIGVERGVSWEDAYAIWKDHHEDQDGFYLASIGNNGKKTAALVYGIGKKRLDTGARLFCITRPSTGRSAKLETIDELTKRFHLATPEETEQVWKDLFEGSNKTCQHNYFHGRCRNEAMGVYCETGRRTRTYFVLSGSVLSVWPIVEEVLSNGMSAREIKRSQRMQIIRVRTSQDHKIVGLLVLPQYVRTLVARFEKHCGGCMESKSNILN